MDYGRIFSRAWAITWRWKVLWVLGFLVSLGRAGTSSNGNVTYTMDSSQPAPAWLMGMDGIDWGAMGAIVLGLLCLGLVIAVIVWIVSIIARGGLVAGVNQVEEDGSTTLGRAWAVGQRRFWTIFGIGVLAALPLIIIGVFAALMVGTTVFFGVTAGEDFWSAFGPLWAGVALCLIPLVCIAVLVSIVFSIIRVYAERAAIIEDLGWIAAFKRGWQLLKAHIGPTIVVGVVTFIVWIVFVAVVAIGLALIAVPFAVLFGNSDPGPWIMLVLCGGGLFALIAGALVGSVLEVFTSASWTLLYRDVTGRGAMVPAPVTAPAVDMS
jgi:hypothetical protein